MKKKNLEVRVDNEIRCMEALELHGKNNKGSTLWKRKEVDKISGFTKCLAHDSLTIDNKKGAKKHFVKEKNKNGKWHVVHEHEENQARRKK